MTEEPAGRIHPPIGNRDRHKADETRRYAAAPLAIPVVAAFVLVAVTLLGIHFAESASETDFGARLLAPSPAHPFGTDRLGRDMLARTLAGLSTSVSLGLFAALASTAIALALALLSGLHARVDAGIRFVIDAVLSLPHLVLLILVAFVLGGGVFAVVVGVALTHWPRLARVLRAERITVEGAEFARTSRRLGRSRSFVLVRHVLPHLLPQAMIGFILIFPHAILHEAGLTFLGFGLEPSHPAIGILLADAMRTLTAGDYWLAVFPGLALLIVVLAFDALGNVLARTLDPRGDA